MQQHIRFEERWHPSSSAVDKASSADGKRLYNRYCATCHNNGAGTIRNQWHDRFKTQPPDLPSGSLPHLSLSDPAVSRFDRIAQIAKFGIPGTDMPGHEYLSDRDIASISLWLSQNRAQPAITKSNSIHTGEEP